jgi:hypothetical protein
MVSEKIALVLTAGPEMRSAWFPPPVLWALDIAGRGGDAKMVLEGEASPASNLCQPKSNLEST